MKTTDYERYTKSSNNTIVLSVKYFEREGVKLKNQKKENIFSSFTENVKDRIYVSFRTYNPVLPHFRDGYYAVV